MSRPSQFQAFTDPAYQARGGAHAAANDAKATRSRLSTIARVYGDERQQVVYQGPPPPLPDPFKVAVGQETRGFVAKSLTYFPVMLAPLLVLLAYFMITRQSWLLRWFRDRKRWIFLPTMIVFFALGKFSSGGKVMGTTPWELILPILVGRLGRGAGGRRLQPGAARRRRLPAAAGRDLRLRRAPHHPLPDHP